MATARRSSSRGRAPERPRCRFEATGRRHAVDQKRHRVERKPHLVDGKPLRHHGKRLSEDKTPHRVDRERLSSTKARHLVTKKRLSIDEERHSLEGAGLLVTRVPLFVTQEPPSHDRATLLHHDGRRLANEKRNDESTKLRSSSKMTLFHDPKTLLHDSMLLPGGEMALLRASTTLPQDTR
jgi:hypothetical protein